MPRLIPLLVLVAACSPEFEKQSRISKLRVLAVRADPPEVVLVPGAPVPDVQLTALAVGPAGEPVEIAYALCNVLGLPAADLDCPGADGVPLQATSPVSASLDLGTHASELPAGVDAVQLAVGFRASSAGDSLHGFATLTVRTSADVRPVRNPAVLDVTADGMSLAEDGTAALRAGSKVHLAPRADDDGVIFSFYATAGDVEALRATAADPVVEWTLPDAAGPVQLWIVARDGRGGVGWLARTVQVVR
jgi:hypothetical protein